MGGREGDKGDLMQSQVIFFLSFQAPIQRFFIGFCVHTSSLLDPFLSWSQTLPQWRAGGVGVGGTLSIPAGGFSVVTAPPPVPSLSSM